ncbi:sel1 repeat family protein [Eubacterium sp. AF17-7]|uniref:MobP2 family relaxase n=1 Tax=Eubacterium sp. AF17-7 TaxID=2293105 RepID=UPI000E5160F9|nr:MobP2 family relaxase [Eubacterium sp. AF17-7]RGG64365.1 sel1 repeat family protein [Eubacterium sp. AF17-7]
MEEIKAGVVVVTEFCRPHSSKFQGYIDYINRNEAVRNDNTQKYNLYQEYMGNPKKTTALFTAEKDKLSNEEKDNLKQLFEKAQENESIMWQTVISFDNRWLKQNGIINEEESIIDESKIKDVTRGAVRRMLENEKLENAIWSGAIHFNTDNLHIHIATVEPIPMREKKEYIQYSYKYEKGKRVKEPILDENGNPIIKTEYKGRFKQSSIEKCKSYVVNELVNDKENNIKINNIIRESIVKQKKEHPLSKDKEFAKAFDKLYGMMPDVNKNLWNYNNPIMAGLRKNIDEISKMYIEKYHADEYRELIERIETQREIYEQSYGNGEKNYKENKLKDLYTRMGNQILKEIRNYDKEISEADNQVDISENQLNESVIGETILDIEKVYEFQDETNEDIEDYFVESEAEIENSYYKWSRKYKKAKALLHQEKPDYETAIMLLIEEHNNGNVLATYELGEIYKHGRGRQINSKTANQYYGRALEGFMYQLKEIKEEERKSGESYLKYRCGKMFYYGQGTEQNYETAITFFEESNNEYAKYMLGKMMYYGQGTDKNLDEAFDMFMTVADENAYAAYKAANMLEQGEANDNIEKYNKEELYMKALKGFVKMEDRQEDDNLEFRIGMMYINGMGVSKDTDKGISWIEKAAEGKNIYAINKLANIYLDSGNEEKIITAINYLKDAANNGKDAMAMYTLGNIYSTEKYGMYDLKTAKNWYMKSENLGNEIASYKLGKIYLKENEIKKSVMHLEKSNNKFSWYTLGKIYLDNESEMFNADKGINYMEQAAKEGNVFAQYIAGKEYYKGKIVNVNYEKAILYLSQASNQDNEFASYILGKIHKDTKDYKNAQKEFAKCTNEYLRPYAEYALGKMYLDKEGSIYNPKRGIEYMERAVIDGNSSAAFSLGITYLKGDVVKQNKLLGISWIEKAAESGNEYAKEFLENRNEKNINVNKNFNAGRMHAMILSNATQFLKKALKNELQRRQNIKEHERITNYGEEKE